MDTKALTFVPLAPGVGLYLFLTTEESRLCLTGTDKRAVCIGDIQKHGLCRGRAAVKEAAHSLQISS